MVVRVSQPWNANLHYDKVLLALTAPTGGQRVLDVGCGDGFLSAALVERGRGARGWTPTRRSSLARESAGVRRPWTGFTPTS